MSQDIREPKQERSIDKKNRIVQAGFEMFSKVGYYNTNTVQIAKQAGVSTGIVYGYFKDKRDILLDVLDIYVCNVFQPIFNIIDSFSAPINLPEMVAKVLDCAIDLHKRNANIHEALHSMTHTDDAVSAKFIALEDEITIKIAQKLNSFGIESPTLAERVHFAMDIVQSYSHEFVYDHHSYINYDEMRTIVINTIVALFNQ